MLLKIEENYEIDLEGDLWSLHRQQVGDPFSYLIAESENIDDIFKAFTRDKASRGHGSTIKLA